MTVHAPIAKFPEVDQADATGELAKIYDDIELTLRAPWVPFAIRVGQASVCRRLISYSE